MFDSHFRITYDGTDDHKAKRFRISRKDEVTRAIEYVRFTKDELKQVYEYCKKHFGEKTEEEIYRKKFKEYTKTDVLAQLEQNPNVTDDMDLDTIADTVAEMYVYNGDYDCNLSYWQNIDNLIYEVAFTRKEAV